MSGIEELKSVVTDTLKKKGVLGKFKAQLRKTIISALDTDQNGSIYNENPKAGAICETDDGRLVAELIREYNEFYDLEYTNSVFVPEASVPTPGSSRQDLCKKLKLPNADGAQPLLAQIVAAYLKGGSPGGAPPPLDAGVVQSHTQDEETYEAEFEEEDYADEQFDDDSAANTPAANSAPKMSEPTSPAASTPASQAASTPQAATTPVSQAASLTPTSEPRKLNVDKSDEISVTDEIATQDDIARFADTYPYVEDGGGSDDDFAKDVPEPDHDSDSDHF